MTRFVVEPLAQGKARVRFETDYQAKGLRGWICGEHSIDAAVAFATFSSHPRK